MNGASWISGPPKKILLATDLSARCDRALDRAVSLSNLWQAKLVVVHVLEDPKWSSDEPVPSWKRPPDPAIVVQQQLVMDMGPSLDTATILIEEDEPVEAILRTVEVEACDLIVTGIAKDELFGRFFLGSTVDRLLRRSRVPVLVVKNRVRQPYSHIAAATDFSESSRHALEVAIRYFPEQTLTMFHAYDPPMSGLVTDPASYRREYRKVAEQECDDFLASVYSDKTIRQRVRPFIEYGTPAHVLREGVRDMGIDLVVLGTHGRGALVESIIGSVAKQIMAEVPCDALVVRERQAATEGAT